MRDFFKQALASFVGLILFFTIGLGGLILLLAAITTAAGDSEPSVANKSILAFDLSLNITDAEPESSPSQIIGSALSGDDTGTPIALRSVTNAIEAAAKDDRIVGLYLHGSINPANTGSGFATLSEVRQALQTFRESGKPIFAYEMSWAERDYYLTSVANTVILNPAGVVEMNGFRSETAFFAGALQKYGVGVQVTRVGQYKSAVEPFLRSDRSTADRQQTQKLLSDLWGDFLKSAAASRNLTPQKIQAIADNQGLLLANDARTAGLIDRVAYEDEVEAELQKLTGESKDDTESFRNISLLEYADVAARDRDRASRNQVALVYAEGNIVSGEGSSGQIGGDTLAKQIHDLRLDEQVKAIVLRINSPGGSATASDMVAREIKLAAAVKPVIVSMGSVAASGGYQIATYATKIFASPNTITGSIGVFSVLPNVQRLANNNGITWDVVKTGRYADIDTIARPRTPQEMAIAQRITDNYYGHFLDVVAESRSLPRERVAELAQGRVWSGTEAKRIGLVDELGGLEAAIKAAASEAKLGDDWAVEEYPSSSSFGAQIIKGLLSQESTRSSAPLDPLSVELQDLRADLETLKSMNDPTGLYTRMPFIPRID